MDLEKAQLVPALDQYGSIEELPTTKNPIVKVGGEVSDAQGAANDGLKPRTTALIIVGLLLVIVAAFAAVELFAGGLIFSSSGGDDDDDGGDDEGGDGGLVVDALGEPVDSYKTTDGCLNNDPTTTNQLYHRTLKKHVLDQTKYPEAVCNDGSPAAYFFDDASDLGHSTLWLLLLQGGSWCTDESSCAHRVEDTEDTLRKDGEKFQQDVTKVGGFATSSDMWASTLDASGLFAAPPCSNLFGANVVWLPYCSSDAWMSSRPASNETFNLHFQGANIVKAVMNELAVTHGLILQAEDEETEPPVVVLGGYSAGGRGAMIHLDNLKKVVANITSHTPKTINVYGLLDSPVWVNIDPSITGQDFDGDSNLVQQAKQAIDLFDIKDELLDDDCLHDNAGEEWKCIFAQYRLKYISNPYTLITSSRDLFVTTMEGQMEGPLTDANSSHYSDRKLAFLEELDRLIRETLVEVKELHPENTVFLFSCIDHAYMHRKEFLNYVSQSDNSTTMLRALELGLRKVGLIPEFDAEDNGSDSSAFAAFSIGNATVPIGTKSFDFEDLFFFDNCALGVSCGECVTFGDSEGRLDKLAEIAGFSEDFKPPLLEAQDEIEEQKELAEIEFELEQIESDLGIDEETQKQEGRPLTETLNLFGNT
mmetsp:Transcript_4843/g.8364  ORF Transcript_4843/g.8364 Transcript_4843/m.8364 type:complete len:648 (+) Transcript_4843:219-2162(+)|eukprot:CAMPEP_0198212292 /NCGR_PEP_ID=MMETSP1445-20131203/25632_1 /TAXON_ID=36898 /ORGANISM="Pyramimonas sp., Strain CCMP2087" /LENGTH=647 /DNA_ID=CAMNT_0043886707 /DNA_START=215 /DNA_END=2158 /DNA_ORIENTATION=-